MPYKLSATLTAHSQDVRALASPSNDLVLSGSRDKTAIAWARDGDGRWEPRTTFRASQGFVGAVAYLPPSEDAPQGYAIAGGQDAIINIYSLASTRSEPDLALVGHTQNVCALAVGPDGTIISGSWDNTAKVWKKFQLAHDLKGHSQSVWAVLVLGDDQYLTGSADKTIKRWVGSKCVRTYEGHTDVVRGLALITDIGFASCSNSGDVFIWTMEGDLVSTLSGHTSFVYALAVLPNGDMLSAGEDRTVRLWHDFDNTQTIVHPAISVWAVSTMPNGDIVSGTSDGVVRIFSHAEERWASADDLREYDAQVASQALPAQQMDSVKTSDPSVLTQPGKKPGQTVMVKNPTTGTVEAHQWDANAHQWQKIGDVVDAVGSGRRQVYEGREYDYVFDIDVEEGAPALKLPYNVNENPYTTAQRFLERHQLPASYLDQVADFITRNTQGATIGPQGGQQYVDPYTGASRYQSSSNSVPMGGTAYQDPYTGASRYSGAGSAPSSGAGAYQDPFTGGGRYVPSGGAAPASTPVSVPRGPQILPVKTPIPFRTANVLRMQDKIQELSATYPYEGDERLRMHELLASLAHALGGGAGGPPPAPGPEHLGVITALLQRWPLEVRWPLLDLGRLVLALSPSMFSGPAARAAFFETLRLAADWDTPGGWAPAQLTPQRATNTGLVLRAGANALTAGMPPADGAPMVQALAPVPYGALNKATRTVYATLVYNFSCLALDAPVDVTLRATHVRLILEVLSKEPTPQPGEATDRAADPETVYRALVALGNVVFAAKSRSAPLSAAERQAAQAGMLAASALPDSRIATVIADIKCFI